MHKVPNTQLYFFSKKNKVEKDGEWELGGDALRRVLRLIASYARLNQMSAVSEQQSIAPQLPLPIFFKTAH